jgi:hypothetical protein
MIYRGFIHIPLLHHGGEFGFEFFDAHISHSEFFCNLSLAV